MRTTIRGSVYECRWMVVIGLVGLVAVNSHAQTPEMTRPAITQPMVFQSDPPLTEPSYREQPTTDPPTFNPNQKVEPEPVPVASGSYESADSGLLKSLFDSLHEKKSGSAKKWYDKLTIRGYGQVRFGDSFTHNPTGIETTVFGDKSISDSTGTFSIRRARLLIAEDVNDYLYFQFQTDFANRPGDSTNTYFGQLRDLYADIYLDRTKVHRIRVGQSKIPWGFEEMQSSGLRIAIDRSDAIDSGNSPNQRDLGAFYYWTPEDKQKLLKELSSGGLKGTGNYGIFALGMYNGQGSSQVDLNRSLHVISRITWPFRLPSGQVVEMSLQGYSGKYVVHGTAIHPNGVGPAMVPASVNPDSLVEQRLAATFVWYPQPFGIQSEWNFGRGPGLNDAQTAVTVRSLQGGYVMLMYKYDSPQHGVFTPYSRFQHYRGGYRSVANAPYGRHDEYNVGCEWQISKALELVMEYGYIDGISLHASTEPGVRSYQNFRGSVLRCQMQVNY